MDMNTQLTSTIPHLQMSASMVVITTGIVTMLITISLKPVFTSILMER